MFLTLLAPQTTGGITGDLSQSLGAVSLTGSGTVVNGPSGSLYASLGSLTYASLRQGLVGAWCPSLGASGYRLIDRSGYGNHGTLTNMDPGTDWVPSGGKLALDFDGTNDSVVSPASTVHATQGGCNWTISAWCYPKGSAGSASTIICRGQSNTTNARDYTLYFANSKFSLQNSEGTNYPTIDSNNTFSTNKWYSVIGVCKPNGSAELFVNGISEGTGTLRTDVPSNNSRQVVLGMMFQAIDDFYFFGEIDDARVYNRVLTPSEIRLLYTGGRGVGLAPERIKHRRIATAVITGDLSKTLAALTASASGSVANGPSGSVSQTLSSLSLSSQGTVADGASGNLSKTLDAATLSSSGTVSSGVTGELSSTLAAATLSSDGATQNGPSATLNSNLAAATLSSDGTVANGPSGSLSSTLAAATLSASGNVAAGASGSLSVTLGDATLSSTGNVGSGTFGSVSQTLASATLSSDGSVAAGVSGSVSQTLAAATLSSSGTLAAANQGSTSQTLASMTCSASGFVSAGLNGAVDAALGSLSLASSGSVAAGNTGSASVQLASAVLAASGTVVTPSVGSTLHVRINGVWKATTPYVKVNGVWKQATAYTKVNGVWK